MLSVVQYCETAVTDPEGKVEGVAMKIPKYSINTLFHNPDFQNCGGTSRMPTSSSSVRALTKTAMATGLSFEVLSLKPIPDVIAFKMWASA